MAALSRPPVRPDTGEVSCSYLGDEMVRADQQVRYFARSLDTEKMERWFDYRERVAFWRYLLLRGQAVPDLVLCPNCGRAHQRPIGTCFGCDAWGFRDGL